MMTAGKPKIFTRYIPATSRYGSNMGTCYHSPAAAEAWVTGGRYVYITANQHPDLEPHQLTAKARALLIAKDSA